jgi:hypothetical protein
VNEKVSSGKNGLRDLRLRLKFKKIYIYILSNTTYHPNTPQISHKADVVRSSRHGIYIQPSLSQKSELNILTPIGSMPNPKGFIWYHKIMNHKLTI